jgi:hypothetical protein
MRGRRREEQQLAKEAILSRKCGRCVVVGSYLVVKLQSTLPLLTGAY